MEASVAQPAVSTRRRGSLSEASSAFLSQPQDPTAFKEADANAKRYRAIHGELAVELDALHPKVLTALAMEGIEANLDLDRLAATRQRQEQGRDRLKELAQKARRAVRDALGGDYE